MYRTVCYLPANGGPYMEVLFNTSPAATPGASGSMVMSSDVAGNGAPDATTVGGGGELYFVVYGVQPGWTMSVSSLSVDGVAYTHDFGSYVTPTAAEAGC